VKIRLLKISSVLTFLLIIISGCYDLPNRIILPQWDTDLNLPIANRRFTIDELIKEQGQISTEGTSVEDSIYILESDLFNLNTDIADFTQLQGTSSLTNIPVLTDSLDQTLYLPFPNGAVIDSASFISGTIEIGVNNPSSSEVQLNISFPGIKDPTGKIFVINTVTPPFSAKTFTYTLAGNTYRVPDSQPPGSQNSLQLDASATTPNKSSEIVFVDLTVGDMIFEYVSGILPATSLGEKQSRFGFAPENSSDYRDKAILREAEMVLDAKFISEFSNPFPVDVSNLNIIGLRDDGNQFYLRDSTGSENLFVRIENGSVKKIFDQNNSNITDFVSFLPDTILLQAEYIVNPENVSGSAAIEDSISFEVTSSAKSFIALKKSTLVDSTEIELSQDQKDAINKGNSAGVTIEFENAVPLSGWLKIDLLDESHNLLFTISKNSNGTDTLTFDGAVVNAEGDVVSSTVNPPVTVQLNTEEVDMLTHTKFAVFSISLETSDAFKNPPTIVAIRPSAWLKLKAYGTVNYRVNPEGY